MFRLYLKKSVAGVWKAIFASERGVWGASGTVCRVRKGIWFLRYRMNYLDQGQDCMDRLLHMLAGD